MLEGESAPATEYVVEEWVLRRLAGVLTRPWTGVRSFDCPSCGSPAEKWDDNRCPRCGEVVEGGRFDWVVHAIEVKTVEQCPPSLTGTTEEVGTDWPTVFDPAVQAS